MMDAPDKIWINWTEADSENPPTVIGACTVERGLTHMPHPIEYTRAANARADVYQPLFDPVKVTWRVRFGLGFALGIAVLFVLWGAFEGSAM